MIGKLYFGTLADLQGIEDPDTLTRPAERIQSISQGATGRRTANVTGIKRLWEITWEHATPEMRTRLETLYQGVSGGILRFVDPLTVNMFPPRTASGGASYGAAPVFYAAGAAQTLVAPPSGLTQVSPAPRLVTQLVSGSVATQAFSGREGETIPATLGPVTFSFVVKSDTAGAVVRVLSLTAESGTIVQTDSQAFAAGAGWQTVIMTVAPPATATALKVRLDCPANSTVHFGPAQAELGSAPTPWVPGTGVPAVVIGSLGETVPFYPYSSYTLTLLEV